MKPIFVYLFLLICICNVSSAQILNIEKARLEKDTTRSFIARASFNFSMFNRSASEEDPVNLLGWDIDFNSIYYEGPHSYMFMGQVNYLAINDNIFLSFGYAHGRVNFHRKRKLHYEVYAQYQYDNFRGLDPRLLAGGGIRLRLVQEENTNLTFGTGFFYEHEQWQHPMNESIVIARLLKYNNYLSIRQKVTDNVDFNSIAYFQTGYDQTISRFRNRVSLEANLNTRITKKLAWQTSFSIAYEDRPIVPVTPVIFRITNGISYSF